jgi:hypothetical protein
MQKVAEVLAGLREERARLLVELAGVDRAIAALEEVLEGAPAPAPPPAPPPPAPPAGPYAKSAGLYEAVAAYLRDAGEPRTSRQIAEALQAGGYPTTATNFAATVRTMLLRTVSSRSYGIRQTTTGHRWFMEG